MPLWYPSAEYFAATPPNNWQSLNLLLPTGFVNTNNIIYCNSVLALNEDPRTTESAKRNKSFLMFPNPAKDLINIKIPKEFINEYLITITDCVGNIIYKKIGTKNKEVQTDLIDIKNLRSGAYILQFSNKDQQIIRKLLKL